MAGAYLIRRIRLVDLDRVLEIEEASFGRESYDRKLFAYYLGACGGFFLGVERGGRLCGYMITCMRGQAPDWRAELVSVAVDPALRKTGAATLLLTSTLRRLRRRRVQRLHLVVRADNAPARAFYQKHGFHRLRLLPRYYEDGGDGILMWRRLQ